MIDKDLLEMLSPDARERVVLVMVGKQLAQTESKLDFLVEQPTAMAEFRIPQLGDRVRLKSPPIEIPNSTYKAGGVATVDAFELWFVGNESSGRISLRLKMEDSEIVRALLTECEPVL